MPRPTSGELYYLDDSGLDRKEHFVLAPVLQCTSNGSEDTPDLQGRFDTTILNKVGAPLRGVVTVATRLRIAISEQISELAEFLTSVLPKSRLIVQVYLLLQHV